MNKWKEETTSTKKKKERGKKMKKGYKFASSMEMSRHDRESMETRLYRYKPFLGMIKEKKSEGGVRLKKPFPV